MHDFIPYCFREYNSEIKRIRDSEQATFSGQFKKRDKVLLGLFDRTKCSCDSGRNSKTGVRLRNFENK